MMHGTDFRFCPHCGTRLEKRLVEDRNRPVCPGCHWVHYLNPLPCAAAFVRDASGKILLVQRGVEPALGKWALPSGFIEIEETPEAACLRELHEETGLDGRIREQLGSYSQSSQIYRNVIIIGFVVDVSGEVRPGSDAIKAEYFPPDNLPEIAFSTHRTVIRDGRGKPSR